MISKRYIIYFLLGIAIILPYVGFFFIRSWYSSKVEEIKNAEFIIIDKETMRLKMYDYHGVLQFDFQVACGKGYGNKENQGDMKTPEGVFHISEIQNSSDWSHDFKDGKGEVVGAYGPWFIRLDTHEHRGIGIHGTHDPYSIGKRVTEGCIRLNNDDLLKLKEKVYPGMTVVILPSASDVSALELNKTRIKKTID